MEDTYDVNTTITHPRNFLKKDIFNAWYTHEESFGRVKYVPLGRISELRIF